MCIPLMDRIDVHQGDRDQDMRITDAVADRTPFGVTLVALIEQIPQVIFFFFSSLDNDYSA